MTMDFKGSFVLLILFQLFFYIEGQTVTDGTTESDEFYFAFPINHAGGSHLQFYIHTMEATAAAFNITSLDGNFAYNGICSPLNPAVVDIPTNYEVGGNEFAWRNRGLRISSNNKKISVIGSSYQLYTRAASLVYPCNVATGGPSRSLYTYYIVSHEPLFQSQFLIVGCHDNSNIVIIPSNVADIPMDPQSSTSTMKTVHAGESHSILLHSMQTLKVFSSFDLTSSKIVSDQPLTVISGARCPFVPRGFGFCDTLMTQVPPTVQWGRTFLLSPHSGRLVRGYKIIASHNNTFIVVTCGQSEVTNFMLRADQSVEFYKEGNTTYCSVVSNHPIYMAKLGVSSTYRGTGDSTGDPTLNTVPPVEQHVHSVQFTTLPLTDMSYFSVVIQEDSFFNGTLIFDGMLQTVSSWTTIHYSDGKIAGYGYSSPINGTHSVTHSNAEGKLLVSVYGWSIDEGYSYAAGASTQNLNNPTVTISPKHGNMLGGTPVIIKGLALTAFSNVTCVFGSIGVSGVRVSNREAMCASPQLPRPGTVELSVIIDNIPISKKGIRFYAQHYSDLADVTLESHSLIITSGQSIRLLWDKTSVIPSSDEALKLDISLEEFKVSFNNKLELVTKVQIASGIDNTGDIRVKLPIFFYNEIAPQSNTSTYSIVLIQISVNATNARDSANPYYNSLQHINNNNAMKPGKWTHVLFRRIIRLRDAGLCSQWKGTVSNHPTSFEGVDACPCTRRQADLPMSSYAQRRTPGKKLIDRFLHGRGSVCYEPKGMTRRSSEDFFVISQECCYNDAGNLIIGGNRAGSVDVQPPHEWENHFIFDLAPFISCCVVVPQLSKGYYEKRPSDNCSNFISLDPPARARGDPHLLTLDGYQYTFNGKGEFILISTIDNSFKLQGRMVSIEINGSKESRGTVFSAIAAKQNDSGTIEVQAGDPRPILLVDGVELDLEDDLSESHSNVTVYRRGDSYRVTFSSGAYIELYQSNGFLSSSVVSLPRSYYGLTRGLLGIYNGDPTDDILPLNSSLPLPLNSSMDVIHSQFGLSWIISNVNESIFSHDSSKKFETFYDPGFTPVFRPVFTDPSLRDEANRICKGDSMCLFDIAATEKTDIGADTLKQQEEIDEIIKIVSTPVFCDPPCSNGLCIANDTCNCQVGYKGDRCDVDDTCSYNLSPVPCEDAVAGWIFNTDTKMCEFGGCSGRGKIFSTMRECVENCGGCSKSASQKQCLVNACGFSKCRAFPHAKCEVDACDPCTAHFISGVREVTDQCELSCDGDNLIEPRDCVIQPCEVTHCPKFSSAVCLPDYCKGCNARFYTEFDVEVTDQCSNCPPSKPELQCPYNPCNYRKCINIPDATCVFDTCGQCKARFYVDDDSVEVTQQCEPCGVTGQMFKHCVSTCPKTCLNYRENVICSQQCQPGCACPDDMVLDEGNNRCVQPENCPCPQCPPVSENCSSVIVPSSNTSCSCPVCGDCPDGQVFQECKTCPETCSEQNNPALVCSDHCTPGCQCPGGELLNEITSTCIQKDKCPEPDHCTLPPVTGPCKGNIRRFHYNMKTGKCETFRYGGCMGNKNNFFSLHDCELACSAIPPSCTPSFCITRRKDMCTLPGNSSSPSCPEHAVSNCQACFYSPTPLLYDEQRAASCAQNCVDSSGEYDSQCLKNWGTCMQNLFTPDYRSVPLDEKVPENYRCFEYLC